MKQKPQKIQTALVFAAGVGTRMRPLTDTTPKPLLKVRGYPLLYHTLDILALNPDIKQIFVNCHYHAEQIIEAVATYFSPRNDINYTTLFEPTLLETGGTITLLAESIEDEAIITVNSDVLFIKDNYSALLTSQFQPEIMDFFMLLQPRASAIGYDGIGEFDCNPDSKQISYKIGKAHEYVYTGMQILKPQLVRQYSTLMQKRIFSLKDLFYDRRYKLCGVANRHNWYHASTPQDLEFINKLDKL